MISRCWEGSVLSTWRSYLCRTVFKPGWRAPLHVSHFPLAIACGLITQRATGPGKQVQRCSRCVHSKPPWQTRPLSRWLPFPAPVNLTLMCETRIVRWHRAIAIVLFWTLLSSLLLEMSIHAVQWFLNWVRLNPWGSTKPFQGFDEGHLKHV